MNYSVLPVANIAVLVFYSKGIQWNLLVNFQYISFIFFSIATIIKKYVGSMLSHQILYFCFCFSRDWKYGPWPCKVFRFLVILPFSLRNSCDTDYIRFCISHCLSSEGNSILWILKLLFSNLYMIFYFPFLLQSLLYS